LHACLLVGIAIPCVSFAQAGDTTITQAYFVQQAAGEVLLIKINAFEAEFESKISGPNGQVLLLSAITGSRIAPLFQYVNASKSARQLDIEVTSKRHTGRTEFGLELTRLSIWDERSKSVSRAYQLLSFGMQASSDKTEASWTVKIDSLINAGRLFQQFGMKEMRLWANYLAALLIQLHLHDHSIVYSMTREILAESKGVRLQNIELAALQLHSAALIGLKQSGSLRSAANSPDPVQAVLARTFELAQSMGLQFEQAQALSTSGADYAAGLQPTKALEQFQLAVDIADAVGDGGLATSIRESVLQIHAIQGNTPASGEVLREMETQLVEGGAGDELALNLLAQGRLLIRSYRYGQAIEVLYEALSHENNSAIRKQINFELAKVFYETGRLDESMDYLQLAEIKPVPDQPKRANTLVDAGEGLWVMANIYRTRGDYAQMQKARSAQGQYQPVPAQYLYDQGLDELAWANNSRQRAQSLFRQSHTAATATGQLDLLHLSRLQFCALGGAEDDTLSLCSRDSVRASYEWLAASGVPRNAIQASYLWTQILVLSGRRSEAITVMERLTDEIHLLRHSLPGVLGAWYRERHERLFEYYLELLVTASASASDGNADGSASLLALSKMQRIERYTDTGPVSNTGSGDTEPLRVLLAQRVNTTPGQVQTALDGKINQGLAQLRGPFKKEFEYLSKTGLQKYLRSLGHDELVLTYHISPTTAQVWVGQKGAVERRNIAAPASLYAALQEARQGLENVSASLFESKMETLGQRLLSPVADLLTETIYWIPAGPLMGFPLDALRLKGRYLVERHRVVNLLSFPANTNPGASSQTGPLQSVFVAGHPRDYSSNYERRLDTSTEIRAIADMFVGPGLHIVQGAALLPDEFQSEFFQQADLMHLSMPGIIDLKYPAQSSLELSGDENGPGRASLKPLDIQSQKLDARLVFLSRTRMNDHPLSSFNNQAGFVADFVDVGVHAVIANLWASDGKAAEAFMTDFYRKLEVSGNIASSLQDAKRQYLKNNRQDGLHDWAGYQLFIE
jgi:CHAT domain-containing protein/tetratricopeptide (TPR) repeat protein